MCVGVSIFATLVAASCGQTQQEKQTPENPNNNAVVRDYQINPNDNAGVRVQPPVLFKTSPNSPGKPVAVEAPATIAAGSALEHAAQESQAK